MSFTRGFCLVAVLAVASAGAHAQSSCALGQQGGMDATGNECGAAAAVPTEVNPAVWVHLSEVLHHARASQQALPAVRSIAVPEALAHASAGAPASPAIACAPGARPAEDASVDESDY